MSTTDQASEQQYEQNLNQSASAVYDLYDREAIGGVLPEGDDKSVGTIIIHADGSFFEETGLGTVGFTLKTNTGVVFREVGKEVFGVETSTQCEARAALEAVREAKKFDPTYLVLYSDCQSIVQKIRDATESFSTSNSCKAVGHELKEIEFTSIIHTPRENNKRADWLAHRAAQEV